MKKLIYIIGILIFSIKSILTVENSLKNQIIHETFMNKPNNIEALLILGANIDTQNTGGESLVIIAAKFGHLDSMRLLLRCHANVTTKDHNDKSALIHARNALSDRLNWPRTPQSELRIREYREIISLLSDYDN